VESEVESQAILTPSHPADDLKLQVLHLRDLLSFIDEVLEPVQQKMHALLLKNQITFDLLWRLFPEGSDVTFKDSRSGLISAGKVRFSSSMLTTDHKLRISK
jgi:hypothetical protein